MTSIFTLKNDENFDDRMEPQCITCDIDSLLWSSRRLYKNCSYFDVYLCPSSSIATEYRVEHYVLECQGPTLPVAGKSNYIHLYSLFFIFQYIIKMQNGFYFITYLGPFYKIIKILCVFFFDFLALIAFIQKQ